MTQIEIETNQAQSKLYILADYFSEAERDTLIHAARRIEKPFKAHRFHVDTKKGQARNLKKSVTSLAHFDVIINSYEKRYASNNNLSTLGVLKKLRGFKKRLTATENVA